MPQQRRGSRGKGRGKYLQQREHTPSYKKRRSDESARAFSKRAAAAKLRAEQAREVATRLEIAAQAARVEAEADADTASSAAAACSSRNTVQNGRHEEIHGVQ